MKKQLWSIAGMGVAVAMLATAPADAQLLHLWNFDQGTELGDTASYNGGVGGAHLNGAPGEGSVLIDDMGTPEPEDDVFQSGTNADLVFEPGYMGHGQAYRPYYVDASQSSTAGAGLTGQAFTSPDQFTIVALVKADLKTSGSAVNYIFQTRPGADRGYYLVQDEDNVPRGTTSGLGSIVGSNFSDSSIPAGHSADGAWFYIAAAIDLTSTPGQATADIYVDDLSGSGLMLAVDDKVWNTADPSALAGATGIFGIGNFAIDRDGDSYAEASQEWFQGAIDFVAVYDGLLDESAIAGAMDLRFAVPEPTSALLALGGLAAAGVRRRR